MKKKIEDIEFMTIGFEYDPEKFEEIKNWREYLNKPKGGLWGSITEKDSNNWLNFCRREDFRKGTHDAFIFKVTSKNILCIDSLFDFVRLMKTYGKPLTNKSSLSPTRLTIDFEKLASKYDGIYVTGNAVWKCRFDDRVRLYGVDSDLYSWDVDSIIVFNKDIINIIKKKKITI